MQSHSGDFIKIDRQKLAEYFHSIDTSFKEVTVGGGRAASQHRAAYETMFGSTSQKFSFVKAALEVESAGYAMAECVNHTFWVVRNAFAIAEEVANLYAKAAGLDALRKEGSAGGKIRQNEFYQKSNTASAVYAFVVASYVLYELYDYQSEKVSGLNLSFEGVPELDMLSPAAMRKCIIAYYTYYLKDSGQVHTQYDFVKMTLLYFQGLLDEIKLKEESLEHLEAFKSRSYKLEGSEFVVDGFEVQHKSVTSVEFNRVEWHEIVGNASSKHLARRKIAALMCFDPATGKNPMKDLGGFARTNLSFGPPGTGKSLEIAAIATELSDRCTDLDIPFLFHPFPDTIVSTYQGGSAERAMEWFNPIRGFEGIVFAPVDDAENSLMDRSVDGVSSGVKEVVGVFLRMTEGAYAIDKGNTLINLYTNLPGSIDPAVLSRVQGRAEMSGAQTLEDFMDQDHIGLFGPFTKLAPGFIKLEPDKYKYMAAQDVAVIIKSEHEGRSEPKTRAVQNILAKARKAHGKELNHDFFATMDVLMAEEYGYTSRDKRNIQSAVRSRMFDFDFPEEWFADSDVFFRQDYETKRGLIIEHMRASLKGKTFEDILLEETVFYFDNFVLIKDERFERDVVAAVHHHNVRIEAARRL